MDFYLYHQSFNKKLSLNSLQEWIEDNFKKGGLSDFCIEESECFFNGPLLIIESNKWEGSIKLETGKEASYSNTNYCVQFLDLPQNFVDLITKCEGRIAITFESKDPDYPEDCVDLIDSFEKLPESCFFGPMEYYRKKMEKYSKSVTKASVTKKLLPLIEPILTEQGFKQDKLIFEKPNGHYIDFSFMSKSDYEHLLCTAGSFQVVTGKKHVQNILPTNDNCLIWYVEPDGSNLEGLLLELKNILQSPKEDWWEDKEGTM